MNRKECKLSGQTVVTFPIRPMFVTLLAALAFCEEEVPGIHDPSGVFFPTLPVSLIDGRGLLPDYPDNRIPIKRFFRFVSAFQVHGDATYGLQKVFGQITSLKDQTDFVWNFSSYGIGGRLSNEDQPSFLFLCELDTELEPNSYGLTLWGQVTAETGLNYSVLLYNGTATFYEVVDVKNQVGSVLLYLFFIGVVAGILYIIFSKDKMKTTGDVKKPNKKKVVRDYAEIHAGQPVRRPSPSPPKRGKTPPRS